MRLLKIIIGHYNIFICFGLFYLASVPGVFAESVEPSRFVDLTHTFNQTTIYWPASKSFELEIVHRGKTEDGYWYEANNISTAEHGGTHMDAPAHFSQGKWRTDQVPLERLIAKGVVIDVKSKTRNNPDYRIDRSDFIDCEQQYGKIPEGCIVLVLTGWEEYWPDRKKYLGADVQGEVKNLHFPGFAKCRPLSYKRATSCWGWPRHGQFRLWSI